MCQNLQKALKKCSKILCKKPKIQVKKAAEEFGVLFIDGDLAGCCARAVVVLDENDHILYTELVEEVTQEPNYQAALSHL